MRGSPGRPMAFYFTGRAQPGGREAHRLQRHPGIRIQDLPESRSHTCHLQLTVTGSDGSRRGGRSLAMLQRQRGSRDQPSGNGGTVTSGSDGEPRVPPSPSPSWARVGGAARRAQASRSGGEALMSLGERQRRRRGEAGNEPRGRLRELSADSWLEVVARVCRERRRNQR